MNSFDAKIHLFINLVPVQSLLRIIANKPRTGTNTI